MAAFGFDGEKYEWASARRRAWGRGLMPLLDLAGNELEPHEHAPRIARQALEPKVCVEALRVLVGRINDKRPRCHDARCRRRWPRPDASMSPKGWLSHVAWRVRTGATHRSSP